MTVPFDELLAEGRAALRAGDAGGARRAFELALDVSASGDVTEGLARVAYLELDYPAAIDAWERAYAAHRDAGDSVGAVRVARSLAYMYLAIEGDRAVSSGWLSRAQTLLAQAIDSPERGWVALNIAMFEGDRGRKEALFRDALELARNFADTDLEFLTLAYLGASLVHSDRTEEGMTLLDEALAAVAGSEVDDFLVLEEIFCQLFAACEHAHDVARADQWIRIGEAIALRRRLPSVSAFCRTHYGGVLTAAGRWPEADAALTEAVRLWGLGRRSMLRSGALVRLADLRVRQGRFEEAEQLLEGIDATDNSEAARPIAAIHLAKGEPTLAGDVLERALEQVDPTSSAAAPLLALLVDVRLAANQLDEAEQAATTLATCAARHQSHYLMAVAALARGRVCLAAQTGDPQACLREALAGFARAQMPIEVAHSRLALAGALLTERPEVAMAEARTALEVFDRLQAARHADAASAVLRSLGVRTTSTTAKRGGGLLTKREAEVLDLLGHGLSNPEISDRLYISRKTVEHHVGNVLNKLGLRSRGEAAAYATRAKPGPERPGPE
ncbi:MAG TPA: LuxR C-terminal-related transcriptional regulator [Ilumatobacteraceae bacterium]|nr:LuxR C-terminal-related transcriptional regulator [Ilumatobacteraceae bacterium]